MCLRRPSVELTTGVFPVGSPASPSPVTYPSLSDPRAWGAGRSHFHTRSQIYCTNTPPPPGICNCRRPQPDSGRDGPLRAHIWGTGGSSRACWPAGGWAGGRGGGRGGPVGSLLGAGSATGSPPGCLRSACAHLSCAWAPLLLGTLGPLGLGSRLCADGNVAAY